MFLTLLLTWTFEGVAKISVAPRCCSLSLGERRMKNKTQTNLTALGEGSYADHRITEWSGLEGTSVGHPVPPPAKAGSPRAGCTGPRPGGS